MVAVLCDAMFCLLLALLENFQSCLHTVCIWIWTWNQICWIIYTCLVVICYETMSLFLFCKWKLKWQVNTFHLIDLRGVVHSVGHLKYLVGNVYNHFVFLICLSPFLDAYGLHDVMVVLLRMLDWKYPNLFMWWHQLKLDYVSLFVKNNLWV